MHTLSEVFQATVPYQSLSRSWLKILTTFAKEQRHILDHPVESLATIQNYKMLCITWPKRESVCSVLSYLREASNSVSTVRRAAALLFIISEMVARFPSHRFHARFEIFMHRLYANGSRDLDWRNWLLEFLRVLRYPALHDRGQWRYTQHFSTLSRLEARLEKVTSERRVAALLKITLGMLARIRGPSLP